MSETYTYGGVTTGFSLPWVGLYNAGNGTPTYSGAQRLARGVKVSVSAETSGDNNFYADNQLAESAGGTFVSGSVSLDVDGLSQDAENLIYGLPEPESLSYGSSKTAKIYRHGDKTAVPYVGIGVVVRKQLRGVVSYVPVVLLKAKFDLPTIEAETQGEEISYQQQSLTATLFRDDSADHNWKAVGEGMATEAEAEAVIKALLGATA